MKKKAVIDKSLQENALASENDECKDSLDAVPEHQSIEKFIKTQRLQNKILKKILENIPEPQTKSIQKKNK